jgi:hypothetical protein
VSRTSPLANHCSTARVEPVYIHDLPHYVVQLDLLLIKVKKGPWIHGTKGWDTLLFLWLTKSSAHIICQPPYKETPQFDHPVNKAKSIVCIFLFQIMYQALI